MPHADRKLARGRRSVNGAITLRVPVPVVKAKCAPYLKLGKPEHRPERVSLADHQILSIYGAEYRGIIQYCLLAGDIRRLRRLHRVMLTSMLKTLAARHRASVTAMARKHKATVATRYGPRRCFAARVERDGRKPRVARFGGIPLRQQRNAVLTDRNAIPGATRKGKELISGSARAAVSYASNGPKSVSTRSASSQTSQNPVSRSQHGHGSWPSGAGRPSWSASAATTPSMHGSQPRYSRNGSLESRDAGKLAPPVRAGGRRKRTCACRHPHRGDAHHQLPRAGPARRPMRLPAAAQRFHPPQPAHLPRAPAGADPGGHDQRAEHLRPPAAPHRPARNIGTNSHARGCRLRW